MGILDGPTDLIGDVADQVWEGVKNPFPTKDPKNPVDKVADAVVKDEKIRASELIRRHTGWRGNNARIAKGVMGGESGFRVDASNYCCHGLMQINVLVHAGKFGIPADRGAAIKWLYDPVNNVKAAYALWLSVGGSWQPWEAYTNGSWKLHTYSDPMILVGKNSAYGVAGDAVSSVADAALGPVDEFVGALMSPSTWFRIGKGVGGIVLIGLGTGAIVFVVASKAGANPAVKAIKTVTN